MWSDEHFAAPRISVVTVVRDDREGLARTYKSLVGQDDSQFEWVVIDGESTDGTWELLNALPEKFTIRRVSSPPEGIYQAMNAAATIAAGDWLWFVNAGDFLIGPSAIAAAKELIADAGPVGIIGTVVEIITPQGYLFDVVEPRIRVSGSARYAEFHHQGALIAASAFQAVGGFSRTLTLAADGELMDRIVSSFDAKCSFDCYVAFVLGGASSRRINSTLAEIRSFREPDKSDIPALSVRIRQSVRDLIVQGKPIQLGAVSAFLLRRRQRRAVMAFGDRYKPVEHWSWHGSQGAAGLRTCCI